MLAARKILGGVSINRFPLPQAPYADIQSMLLATPQKGDPPLTVTSPPRTSAIALTIAATGAHDDASDVSVDSSVTSLDALIILQAAAGRIEL